MPWIEIAALVIAALAASTVVFWQRARKARQRMRLLAEVASVSEEGSSLEETFDAICGIVVPEFADFCMIDVIGEDRVPRRAAVRVGPGGKPEFERGLAERAPSLPPRLLDDHEESLSPRFY